MFVFFSCLFSSLMLVFLSRGLFVLLKIIEEFCFGCFQLSLFVMQQFFIYSPFLVSSKNKRKKKTEKTKMSDKRKEEMVFFPSSLFFLRSFFSFVLYFSRDESIQKIPISWLALDISFDSVFSFTLFSFFFFPFFVPVSFHNCCFRNPER